MTNKAYYLPFLLYILFTTVGCSGGSTELGSHTFVDEDPDICEISEIPDPICTNEEVTWVCFNPDDFESEEYDIMCFDEGVSP